MRIGHCAAEGDSAKGAARRRKQVLMLFGGALAAIALAMLIVRVAFYSDVPAELPSVPREPGRGVIAPAMHCLLWSLRLHRL